MQTGSISKIGVLQASIKALVSIPNIILLSRCGKACGAHVKPTLILSNARARARLRCRPVGVGSSASAGIKPCSSVLDLENARRLDLCSKGHEGGLNLSLPAGGCHLGSCFFNPIA